MPQIIDEHLLYVTHCSGFWEQNVEQDKRDTSSWESYFLLENTDK